VRAARLALGGAGILMIGYGIVRLVHSLPAPMLALLGGWLLAVVIIQLAVLSPVILAVGVALRVLPDRGRGFVQAGLIAAAAVTIIAIPLILRQHSQPAAKAMLLQDYRLNLLLLLALIAAGLAIAYAVRVARDRVKPPGA